MAVINRVPRGLLPLLDAKTGGQTPKEFSGQLTPVLDLYENYSADIQFELETQNNNAVLVLGSLNLPVTVPEGEQWLVYSASASARYSTGAQSVGCTLLFSPGPAITDAIPLAMPANDGPFTAFALQTMGATWTPERPVLFRSGNTFWMSPTQGTYNAVNANNKTQVLFRKLLL